MIRPRDNLDHVSGRTVARPTLFMLLAKSPFFNDRGEFLSAFVRHYGWLLLAALLPLSCSRPPEIPNVATDTLDPALATRLRECRSNLVAAPNSAEPWGRFAQVLNAAEFHSDAIACYQRAASMDPTSPRWPHLLGLLLLQDQPDLALIQMERAAALAGSTNDAPRLRLVQALVERARYPEAEREIQALLSQRPDHPAACLELGRIRLAQGRAEELATILVPCLTNVFTARPALLLLSQGRAREGKAEAAAELSRRAASMPKPFDWPDAFLMEVQSLRADRTGLADRANALLAQKRFSEADPIIARLLEQNPNDPEALLLAGRSSLLQRQCVEAESRFREHLDRQPQSLNGLIQLSLALLCQQRWQDASQILEKALTLKPDFAQAHANLGLAQSRLGHGEAALASYANAVRCQPGDTGSHAAMAEECLKLGRLDEARTHADAALRIDPAHAKAKAIDERLRQRR
ncbi:MAG: tetratricopeptide repeat protein [Verrucomicrobiales bacterium]|nr:tetratricopeptide repeat protein [Verrucomicrobiales bacterium]